MLDSNKLSKLVLMELQAKHIEKETAITLIKKINEREDIAIIGMGCKIADAENCEEYWDRIVNKKVTIKRCSAKRIDLIKKSFPKILSDNELKYSKGSYFDDIDLFDADFFSLNENEAKMFAPGHRVMLQTVYRALEDAGYLGEANKENKTAIFMGTNFSREMLYSYSGIQLRQYGRQFTFEQMIGNWSSGLATKIAGILNLKGGAYMIDAGCPSSAIAINNACMALKAKQCDMAMVGGITIDMAPIKLLGGAGSMYAHEDNVVSRTYDKDPGGAYAGEACAAILLKPLSKAIEDGDKIHGIICGGSLNNNGSDGAFMQSSSEDIKKATIAGIKAAQISAEDIEYLEGEGIVNKIEEGLELSGMINAFRFFGDKRQYCAIGSLSPNFGYLQAPIGALQLIKICMAFKKNIMPPQIHFNEPTEMVNFIKSPFYINTEAKNWNRKEDKIRYAATFGYGYGGNNLFTILKEPPEIVKDLPEEGQKQLFVLTAATGKSFDQYIKSYIDFLADESNDINLTNICYNASVCRILKQEYRLAAIVENKENLLKILKLYAMDGRASDQLFIGTNINNVKSSKNDNLSPQNKSLEQIALDFCSGIDYSFAELFSEKQVFHCDLPLYPLDKVHYWNLRE